MFLTYTVLTQKSKVKVSKIVSFVNDVEKVTNFVNAKKGGELVELLVGKSLHPTDLTAVDLSSLEEASFKDLKAAYPKLCMKIVIK